MLQTCGFHSTWLTEDLDNIISPSTSQTLASHAGDPAQDRHQAVPDTDATDTYRAHQALQGVPHG